MRTRYGISPWIDNFPRSRRPDHPRLRGELSSEVAIIGGGLTGCATAYACAVAGLKPILIEADRIGQGSAGRGAGLLLPEPGPSFRDVSERHGLRTSRRIFESWRRASLDAAALIRRLRIQCGLEACDYIEVASRDDGKGLRREYEANSQDNRYLLNQISQAYEDGDGSDLPAVLNVPDQIQALTGDAVQQAAQTYLDMTRYIKVVLMPEKKNP